MVFIDRNEAGEKLAQALLKYKNAENTIVLGLPRGGVVTAGAFARALNLPLDVTCPRKIGAPFNPELAIGAITETGHGEFNRPLIRQLEVPEEYIKEQIEIEKKQAERRLALFRKDLPARKLKGTTVILVEDGLATGATMKAAIQSVKAEKAAKIIVAVPVSPKDTFEEIEASVDEAYCLEIPFFFNAVGQFYEFFTQVEDNEVLAILQFQKKG